MAASSPTLWIAFIAGILSFVSPCVLPLVPAYISYLGGKATQQVSLEMAGFTGGGSMLIQKNKLGIFLHGLFFVLGLVLFFVSFGLFTNASLHLLAGFVDLKDFLQKAGGILAIFFGLHILGVTGWTLRNLLTRVKWDSLGAFGNGTRRTLERIQASLYGDTRRQMNTRSTGYASSALMGLVFAAGWSPCIGPIYGSILDLSYNATTGTSFLQAGVLLLAYSLGLGMPFLLAAVGLDQMRGLMKRLQRRMRLIEIISGVFLIVMGVLLYTGELTVISQAGSGLTSLSNLEGCGTGVIQGNIPARDFNTCMTMGLDYKLLLSHQNGAAATSQPTAIPTVSTAQKTVGLGVGQIAPDFSVNTLGGQTISLKSLRGTVVLLNFWATWCGPCTKEMPTFQQLGNTYDPKTFRVLAVDYAETPAEIGKFVDKLGLTLTIGLDPKGEINHQFEVAAYPVSYVIGRDGTILARQSGAFPDGQLEAALKGWVSGQ